MLLLTGPAGSGKTQRILSEFRDCAKSRQRNCRLVVPTATLAQHLRNELAREGLVLRPQSIVTLAGFTSEICAHSTGVDPVIAGDLALTLAAEAAAREGNAKEFDAVRGMPGFHAALVQTIGELDSAGCDAEQFSNIPIDAPLAGPLLALWRNIERQLSSRGILMRSQALRRASELAENWTHSMGTPRVWFDGFAGFTQPELQLIEALASKTDVTVALSSLETGLPAAGFHVEELPSAGSQSTAEWFQAENLEREADEIARRILLEHDAGTEFREMAVALRNPDDHAPLLENTFERFGIPARLYFGGRLSSHPIAAFAARLIEALLSGWDLAATLAALRLAPGLSPSPSMDRWDIAIRECIPGAGLDLLRELAGTSRTLVSTVDRLADLDAWRPAMRSPQQWAESIAELPAIFHPASPHDRTSWSETAILRGQAAAAKEFAIALEAAAAWLGTDSGPISLERFWQTAGAVLQLSTFTVPDGRRNVVHVMSVFEARQWNPAITFIPNLVEKVFPRYHSHDPFLPDSAIRQLQTWGFRLRDSRARDIEEASLFDSVAIRHQGKLYLSYPRINPRGAENLRSAFFNRLPSSEVQPQLVRPQSQVAPVSMRAPAPLHDAQLLARTAELHPRFSPSSLEAFARCPFQFFAGRTLKLKSLPDTPEDRLSFLIQGTIVHEVLKRWTAIRGDVKPIFEAVFSEVCAAEHIQSAYRTEVLRQQMLADLENFCASFETYGTGEGRVEESFEFALLPELTLRGRIDRIDTTATGGAIVVDYKYSNNTKQNVEDASKLQGVLYTIAAERTLGLQPQATIFVSVKGEHKPVGWGELPGYELLPLSAEWLEKGLATAGRVVREIREGIVQPSPSDVKHCRYCDFRDACRFETTEAVRTAR